MVMRGVFLKSVGFALALASVVACGGSVERVGDDEAEQPVKPAPPPVESCMAYPSCDQGDDQVASSSACLQDDARCYQRSMCNSTIWCTGPSTVQCAAYPSCDTGDTQVKGPSGCLQDDAKCYDRTLCGATIWCTGPTAG
jgi:hypothetical protein